jgi:hypothetical protein
MAGMGKINVPVDVEISGSAVRLEALRLSVEAYKDTTVGGRPPSAVWHIDTAAKFEVFITMGMQ